MFCITLFSKLIVLSTLQVLPLLNPHANTCRRWYYPYFCCVWETETQKSWGTCLRLCVWQLVHLNQQSLTISAMQPFQSFILIFECFIKFYQTFLEMHYSTLLNEYCDAWDFVNLNQLSLSKHISWEAPSFKQGEMFQWILIFIRD